MEELIKEIVIPGVLSYYEINIPRQGGSYSNHQLCTFSLPPPELGQVYTYLFLAHDIEHYGGTSCQCYDSLLYEHTEDAMPLLSCGDEINTRLKGKVLISSNITITFRSNEAVTRSGTSFLVTEWLPEVCT